MFDLRILEDSDTGPQPGSQVYCKTMKSNFSSGIIMSYKRTREVEINALADDGERFVSVKKLMLTK